MMNQVRKISLVVVMSALVLGNVCASGSVDWQDAKKLSDEIETISQAVPANQDFAAHMFAKIKAEKEAKAAAKAAAAKKAPVRKEWACNKLTKGIVAALVVTFGAAYLQVYHN